MFITLQWRHNEHDSVSNHQPHGCLLNCLFRRRWKKTSKLRVTGLCVGNSPGPVNSPHKGPVTRKMFPFDDVIIARDCRVYVWSPVVCDGFWNGFPRYRFPKKDRIYGTRAFTAEVTLGITVQGPFLSMTQQGLSRWEKALRMYHLTLSHRLISFLSIPYFELAFHYDYHKTL